MPKSRIEKAIELLAQEETGKTSLSIFPIRVEHGEIVTSNGQTLLTVNQERDTTSLSAAEQDRFIQIVVKLLNQNQSSIEQALKV